MAHPGFSWTAEGRRVENPRPPTGPRPAMKPRRSRARLVTWRGFEKGLTRNNPVLAGLIAQRIAEALLDRPGADLARVVQGEKADLQVSWRRLALEDARDRLLQASSGEWPWRISSTTRKLPTLRITSSPTPVEVAAPISPSTYRPAPMIGLSRPGRAASRPCRWWCRRRPGRPCASRASMPMVS